MAHDARERLIFLHFLKHLTSPLRDRLELLQPTNLADAITKGERYAARINADAKSGQILTDKLSSMEKRLEAIELTKANPPKYTPIYTNPRFPQNKPQTSVNKPAPPTCFYCKKPGHYKSNCPLMAQFTRLFERLQDDTDNDDESADPEPDFQLESAN
jgi:hypothetical protein